MKKETELLQLHAKLSSIKSAVIDCFGKNPMGCNGALMVSVEKYDKLVDAVNLETGDKK